MEEDGIDGCEPAGEAGPGLGVEELFGEWVEGDEGEGEEEGVESGDGGEGESFLIDEPREEPGVGGGAVGGRVDGVGGG